MEHPWWLLLRDKGDRQTNKQTNRQTDRRTASSRKAPALQQRLNQ